MWILIPILVGLTLLGLWLRSTQSSSRSGVDEGNAAIHYLGPDEYYLNRGAYIQQASGETRMDTVLLPLIPDPVSGAQAATDGGYVGPDVCAECHRENYEGQMQTAHARTTTLPSRETVLGSFADGENVLQTASPNLRIEMIEDQGKLFQRMVLMSDGQPQGGDFPFDIVTGSGRVGQTYLYFQGEHLYQLHASYLSGQDSWMNSPGYLDGVADFARPVLAACLECHTTYYQPYEGAANQYHREHFVLGVTCEKCHGPGAEHVEYHRRNPEQKSAHAIVNPANLSVERSLELCQLCHGGDPLRELQPPFSYRPGERLSEYYEFPQSDGSQLSTGVHTNTQLPRLKRSACFQQSESMTCIDCHNPHQHERGDLKLFSERCIRCHEPQACGKFELLGEQRIRENCIDCHMLEVDMSDIKLNSGGQRLMPTMRDHYIRVWDEATEEYLQQLDRVTQGF
ncbi:MAG: C cytochrome precursor [bacterium]|nr:C cytochrome precursor [bacterium]